MFELPFMTLDRWEKLYREGKYEEIVKEYDEKYKNKDVGDGIPFASYRIRIDALTKLGVKCLRFNRIKR